MDKQQVKEMLRTLAAEMESLRAKIISSYGRLESEDYDAKGELMAPPRPSGGDGWQRGLATFWSCEMKQTMKGEALRGRLGVSWKEPDGQVVKKFYSVFDEKLCEKIEQVIEKGQPIKIKLKPWKDTEIVVDFEMGRA